MDRLHVLPLFAGRPELKGCGYRARDALPNLPKKIMTGLATKATPFRDGGFNHQGI
jgi:hypothetical protein